MLPPVILKPSTIINDLCASDQYNPEDKDENTFMESILRVGEDRFYDGPSGPVPSEIWAHVPLERERLMGLAQQSINNGKTKVCLIIFGSQTHCLNSIVLTKKIAH